MRGQQLDAKLGGFGVSQVRRFADVGAKGVEVVVLVPPKLCRSLRCLPGLWEHDVQVWI